MTIANGRTADHPVHELFLKRWSPRAYTGEPIPADTLSTIFEAARWAPSSYNSQPWRFLYARRETDDWALFLGLLNAFNQSWVKNAAAIVFAISARTFVPPGGTEAVVSQTHSFDTGAAWSNLALQAALIGWDAHAFVGLDHDRAYRELAIPDTFRLEAGIAIGRRGDASLLPEALAARERPSDRLPLSELVLEGRFQPA